MDNDKHDHDGDTGEQPPVAPLDPTPPDPPLPDPGDDEGGQTHGPPAGGGA